MASLAFRSFARLAWLRASALWLARQLAVREAAILGGFHRVQETGLIVLLPFVEAVSLFVEVSEQMERRAVDVRAFDSALEQRPEIFEAVRVNAVLHVGFRVVNDLVNEVERHVLVTMLIRLRDKAQSPQIRQPSLQRKISGKSCRKALSQQHCHATG